MRTLKALTSTPKKPNCKEDANWLARIPESSVTGKKTAFSKGKQLKKISALTLNFFFLAFRAPTARFFCLVLRFKFRFEMIWLPP